MRATKPVLALASLWLGFTLVAVTPDEAQAIPAFARKYGAQCSTCHTAWPLLNGVGREFKENGFKFQPDEEPQNVISDFLQLDDYFPVAAIIKARPYDKKESGSDQIRAIHEVELITAGVVAKDISAFLELEGEDEDGFDAVLSRAYAGYHPTEYFNIQLAYGAIFSADPYDTLSGRRLTRERNILLVQRFGGADNNGRFKDARQSVGIYGRLFDRKLFYNLSYSAVPGEREGDNPHTFHARLAFDLLPDVTLGAFGVLGECQTTADNCSRDRDFDRAGIDVQAEFPVPYGTLRLDGAYIRTGDDLDAAGRVENDAWFAEWVYVVAGEDDRPWIVPSFRFDHHEENDGRNDFGEVTFNLSYYLYENVKIFGELFKQVDVPDGAENDGRFTIQAEVGF